MTQALFALGKVGATPAAVQLMLTNAIDPLSLLARHVSGDWGLIPDSDVEVQMWSLADEKRDSDAAERILSSYAVGAADPSSLMRIDVLTEADRAHTTFLLPDEY